jgi:N-glycosylase/DNA lyase
MELNIEVPRAFSFKRTAISHGWYDLPPFSLNVEDWTLTRVIDLDNGPLEVSISTSRDGLRIELAGRPGKRGVEKVISDVRHMLRLDEDLTGFYAAVAGEPCFSWIGESGAGRLLRSPTVFEDLVKTICTTNCSWALTAKMVNSLVNHLGNPTRSGRRSFPSPQALADQPLRFYRDKVSAGYRAPYLKELAKRVASGDLDPEAWLTSNLPTIELKQQIKQVKGAGDYAAENLLKLLGRYDVLALDSWVRAKFARTRNGARKTSDKKIERHYARYGEWRGLALWCDLTGDWMEGESVSGFY